MAKTRDTLATDLRMVLPCLLAEVEVERAFFGANFWPYDLKRNRLTAEALFAPNILDEVKI